MPDNDTEAPRRVSFLLLPDFALMSYASVIEPLRAANLLAGRTLYQWNHVSPDGSPVRASNGAHVLVDHRVGTTARFDLLFVCAGGASVRFRDKATLNWLRKLGRQKITIGGVSGGAFILARANLLDGYRCTIHWEHIPAFKEEFPTHRLSRNLYVIDRDRLTCGGGVAALDLMHTILERHHGAALAGAVSEWFLHREIRTGVDPQRRTLRERYCVRHPGLLKALARMEHEIERPPSRADLAACAGTSIRQLERLFASELRTTINAHSLILRLRHARSLLRETTKPVLEISLMCGFASASHFSRNYRAEFGQSPGRDRGSDWPLRA